MTDEDPRDAKGRFARALLRRRGAVIVGTLAVAAAALPGALRVERDDSVRAWFEPGAAVIERYDVFEALFGSDDLVVLVLAVEDPFAPAALSALDALTRAIEALPEIERARSLSNVRAVAAEPDGSVFIGELVAEIPPDERSVARARERLREDPLLRTRVVAADGHAVAITARLRPGLDERARHRATQAIRSLASARVGSVPPMAGQPVLDEAFFRLSNADSARLLPLTGGLMAGAMLWIFRSTAALLLPLGVVAVSVTLTLALLAGCGFSSNILVEILPLILLIVGIFSSIHLMLETRRFEAAGAAPREAVARAVARVLTPTLAANLTTAAGFASFAVAHVPPVKSFGLFAALGIVASCALTLTFLPAGLSFFRLARARPVPLASPRLWRGLARAGRRRPGAILGVAGGLALLAALAVPRLERTENWLEYFPEGHPLPRSVALIEEQFFGVGGLEVVLRGPASVLLEPAVLRRVDALAERLRQEPEVERTLALPDFLKPLHRALHGGREAAYALPEQRAAVEQYLLLLREPGGELARFLTADHRATRISARVHMGDGRRFGRLVELAEREARGVDPRLESYVTGVTELNHRNGENIVALQAASLAVAFPVVTLVAAGALRRLRLVPVVAVASALPVLGVLGFMALAGIPLTAGSALAGSVVLGFVVDDAVFLLARLREAPAADDDALGLVFCEVGPGLAATSLVVCVGFAVLAQSRFTPNAHFGLLTCLALALAFAVNVLVLPALVRIGARGR